MNFQNENLQTPPVVLNLVIINALIYLAQVAIPGGYGFIIEKFALFFPESSFFRPYQLLTYMFLHANFSHILFNMFALWMFGRTLEYAMGSKRFLIYYLVCGIGAALIQMGVNWIEIEQFKTSGAAIAEIMQKINIPTLGASGAVFGLLLGFGMLYPNNKIMLIFPPVILKAKYFVIIYGLIELFSGVHYPGSGVAHFAHVGGMLWGFLLLLMWKKQGKIRY